MNTMRTVLGLFMGFCLVTACSRDQVASGGTGGTGMVAVRGQVFDVNSGTTATQVTGVAVSAVDNVVINGIPYDMTGAEYPSGTTALEKGMVVTLVAVDTGTTRTAQTVVYTSDLKGPVTALNGSYSLMVLGHTVFWDDRTQFNPLELKGGLAQDKWLEISGYAMDDGRVHATYIAQAAADAEAAGFVTAIDAVAETLTLNNVLKVTNADPDFDLATVHVWDRIKVTGTSSGASIDAAVIEKLENMGDLGAGDEDAEVEGLVTGFVAGTSTFFVAGQPVMLTDATVFSGGSLTDIIDGVHLEVEGPFQRDANGVYYVAAKEVEFEDGIEITAPVESYAGGTMSFFSGVVAVRVIESTQSYAGLAAGDCVEVRARQAGADIIATQVERQDACLDSELKLQGPVEKIDGYTITVLGMTVDTLTISLFSQNDTPSSREGFLASLTEGDLVSLEGQDTSGFWSKAEIEN